MKSTPTRTYLERLFIDAGRVELRHNTGSQWATSWHIDVDDLLAAAREKAGAGNLYTSLHHVGVWREDPVTNDDIDRFTRIFLDLDPCRPAGTASTADELAGAKQRAIGLQRYLSGHGWPMPAFALSGNGYHLQYRTAFPVTDETRGWMTAIYTGLADRHGDDVVSFDKAVRNPGRICTLYGSIKRKGPGTADRPHRQSQIMIPYAWEQVRAKQIEKLAETYAKESKPKPAPGPSAAAHSTISSGEGSYATLDVIAWFSSHGAYVQPLTGNVHGVRCPWSAEHSTASPSNGADTVIFESDGSWPGFHCKHSHCADRGIREVISIWSDADQFCRDAFVKSTGCSSSGGQRHV